MPLNLPSRIVSLCALSLLLRVASAGDLEDWPCEQALVSEVEAAVVWDGPDVTAMAGEWGQDREVAALAHRLTDRRLDHADDEAEIGRLAATLDSAQHDHRLSLLFAGVLQLLNADRQRLQAGILRYARDQQWRAESLGDDLAEIARLEGDSAPEAQQQLQALQHRVEMEQRMFDERERAIPFLCTRPRVVEQRIGELARAIAYQMQ